MNEQQIINHLTDLEVLAEMVETKASAIKKEAHKARIQLAGVSTLAARKGLAKECSLAVAKRNRRIIKGIK